MELKNSFPVTFSALGINLQKFTIFPLRFLLHVRAIHLVITCCSASTLYQFSNVSPLESFPKCIVCYWFMALSAKKKYVTSISGKHLGHGFSWIFMEPKTKLTSSRRRGIYPLLLIVYLGHVIFPEMCGKLCDCLLLVDFGWL